MSNVIEGQWDELIKRSDLQGHKVCVIVLDEVHAPPTPQEWIEKLEAWANRERPVRPLADDSRDSIYSGTLDDPR